MSQSLSVILPVHNFESKLAAVTYRVLEVTSELTRDLELMIVDDGSTDHTIEVAMDLRRLFPQIQVIRNAEREGFENAAKKGFAATRGDIVLIHNVDTPISSEMIHELWRTRSAESTPYARHERAHQGNAVPDMHAKPTWKGETLMLRRDSAADSTANSTSAHVSPAQRPNESSPPSASSTRRTNSGSSSATPAIFHQHPHVEMQPIR